MKTIKVLIGFFLVTILTSCVTMKPNIADLPRPEMDFQNDLVDARLNCQNSHWATISIENKSDKVITLIWDLSSFTSETGNSQRLIPEGTKYINANSSIPPITIAPNSRFIKSFSSSESFYYQSGQYGGWRDIPWIPKDLRNTKFVFGYRIGQNDSFIVFDGNESSVKMEQPPKVIGSVRYEKTIWNILFIKSPTKRRLFLLNQAKDIAKDKYGDNIELINIEYRGKWSPFSLVLYFSALGFVEHASITADVVMK